MKCSQNFNLLDARGAISVSERADLIKEIRNMARVCAGAYINKDKPKENPADSKEIAEK